MRTCSSSIETAHEGERKWADHHVAMLHHELLLGAHVSLFIVFVHVKLLPAALPVLLLFKIQLARVTSVSLCMTAKLLVCTVTRTQGGANKKLGGEVGGGGGRGLS